MKFEYEVVSEYDLEHGPYVEVYIPNGEPPAALASKHSHGKWYSVPNVDVPEALNILGGEGWELISCGMVGVNADKPYNEYVFKRANG